ncbi:MAG: hypothetical protein KGL39_06150 [Patescibacteria group bacterium]|nr:hypothetical protein [Patescibacteria group bacterium]
MQPLTDGSLAAEWAVCDSIEAQVPRKLHPDSKALVKEIAYKLGVKLYKAEQKYGYSNNWLTDDWEHICQRELRKHIEKGDPLDVIAYCSFMLLRDWSIRPELTDVKKADADVCLSEENDALIQENKYLREALNEVVTNGEWDDNHDWLISENVYRMAQESLTAQWQEFATRKLKD